MLLVLRTAAGRGAWRDLGVDGGRGMLAPPPVLTPYRHSSQYISLQVKYPNNTKAIYTYNNSHQHWFVVVVVAEFLISDTFISNLFLR